MVLSSGHWISPQPIFPLTPPDSFLSFTNKTSIVSEELRRNTKQTREMSKEESDAQQTAAAEDDDEPDEWLVLRSAFLFRQQPLSRGRFF